MYSTNLNTGVEPNMGLFNATAAESTAWYASDCLSPDSLWSTGDTEDTLLDGPVIR